ncbi:hypothetical protein [Streptomyces sp. SID13031]|nr:hypothetical protein [Streptomyces sp. SID13031]NEA32051.1 hypothetical protein [Streptomyces sp. SID13031]
MSKAKEPEVDEFLTADPGNAVEELADVLEVWPKPLQVEVRSCPLCLLE